MSNRVSRQQANLAWHARSCTGNGQLNRETVEIEPQKIDAPMLPQCRRGKKVSILLIDDEAGIRALLNNALVNQGYQCQEASDGLAGLALWQAIQPDLILLDITMPGVDGLEVLREIRRYDPIVGIIMVSALNFERLADKALVEAADGYVKKPFRTQMLLQEIDRVNLLVYGRKSGKSGKVG